MAPSTIRKAIGAVKDQTSISLAKVTGNIAPDLEVLVLKATTHDDEPADEKYLREIMSLLSYSRNYVTACVATVSKRVSKTHDWIVAIKSLMLVHRLIGEGNPLFGEEIVYSTRRGMRILNMADFRDEAHSHSWDHAGFVRVYAMYLDEKVEFDVLERKSGERDRKFEEDRCDYGEFRDDYDRRSRSYGDFRGSSSVGMREKKTPTREMKAERVLGKLEKLLKILDRVLACRATGYAKNSRLVLVALHDIVRESFELYLALCEALNVLLDRFTELDYGDSVRCFDLYVSSAKMIDELLGFYNWCKDMGIARSSEYPQVQRITDEVLETLEGLLKEIKNRPKSPVRSQVQKNEEKETGMKDIKALPPPANHTPPPPPLPQMVAEPKKPQPQPKQQQQVVASDLVNLRDDGVSADEQGNTMALALFSGPTTVKPEGSWEAFPSDGDTDVKSAWQTPAAEIGKADWELTLVETASNLSKQQADLAGGLDPLLLHGMYDHGMVNQHTSSAQLQSGSASSVALPSLEKTKTPMLALPAPDGTMKPVGPVDPFAASLAVPPPSYVQIAEMEKKQQLLVQEQHTWQQYARDGMLGQSGLAKVSGGSVQYAPMAYGMPQQPGGYYYAPPPF